MRWTIRAAEAAIVLAMAQGATDLRCEETISEIQDAWGYVDKTVIVEPELFTKEFLWELAAPEIGSFAADSTKFLVLRIVTSRSTPMLIHRGFHCTVSYWEKRHKEYAKRSEPQALFIGYVDGGMGWRIRYADGRLEDDWMGGDPFTLGEGGVAGEILFVSWTRKYAPNINGDVRWKYYPKFSVLQPGGLDMEAAERYNSILQQRLGPRNYELAFSENVWCPHLTGYPFYNPFYPTPVVPPRERIRKGRYILCAGVGLGDGDCRGVLEFTNEDK